MNAIHFCIPDITMREEICGIKFGAETYESADAGIWRRAKPLFLFRIPASQSQIKI